MKKSEILVDGVSLRDRQTAVVSGLARIGWYTCIVGAFYAADKLERKFKNWKKDRQYKNFLKQVERKEREEAKKA